MTPEKAIELLHPTTTKEAIRKIEENGENAIKAIEEACIVACEALEKQVPKKPKKDTEGLKICPNCQSHYIFGDDDIMYDYCPDCGQKLKWGEDDDGEGED